MKKINYIFLICFLPSTLFAQYSEWKKYLPLQVGNAWYYHSYSMFHSFYYREFIESDTIINGNRYYKRMQFRNGNVYGAEFIRIDSTNGNYLLYYPNQGCGSYPNDKILDSLASNINDQINCHYLAIYTRKCTEIGNQTIFGFNKEYKKFLHDGLVYGSISYTKDFGITSSCSGEPPPCSGFITLIGCRINDIVYGDTNLVSVQTINSNVPTNFSLSQNYPNPFNPTTNIKFSLPTTQYTILRIFDITGREVATLVNEVLQPGEYNYEFRITDYELSSGVYFYQLRADSPSTSSGQGFVQTRKMVLTK